MCVPEKNLAFVCLSSVHMCALYFFHTEKSCYSDMAMYQMWIKGIYYW